MPMDTSLAGPERGWLCLTVSPSDLELLEASPGSGGSWGPMSPHMGLSKQGAVQGPK